MHLLCQLELQAVGKRKDEGVILQGKTRDMRWRRWCRYCSNGSPVICRVLLKPLLFAQSRSLKEVKKK
jgi:hypothetical protein